MTDTATVTATTYHEHADFHVTVDPSKAPEPLQSLIALQGPELVEQAARGSFNDVLDEFIRWANDGGAGYLTVERVPEVEEAVTE